MKPNHNRSAHHWSAVFAVLFIAVLAGALPASGGPVPAGNIIIQALRQLPAEAFDNTTEGMEEDEFKTLLTKGESENWSVKSATASRVVFAAKHPFSEVHFSFRTHGGRKFLEALTFNEKVVDYRYWIAGRQALEPYSPPGIFRVFNETETSGQTIPLKSTPAEIMTHVEKLSACFALRSESSDGQNTARKKDIEARIAGLKCEQAKAGEEALRKKFAGQTRWLGVLDRAAKIFSN